MQYQVPQFIEVEDRIFGPLTLKQFVYLAGGAGLAFLIWRALPIIVALPIAAAVVGLSVALAFVKINKKPFIEMVEAGVMYFVHSKLYLWDAHRQEKQQQRTTKAEVQPESQVPVPSLSENKLKELAWSLDINERLRLSQPETTIDATSRS